MNAVSYTNLVQDLLPTRSAPVSGVTCHRWARRHADGQDNCPGRTWSGGQHKYMSVLSMERTWTYSESIG